MLPSPGEAAAYVALCKLHNPRVTSKQGTGKPFLGILYPENLRRVAIIGINLSSILYFEKLLFNFETSKNQFRETFLKF